MMVEVEQRTQQPGTRETDVFACCKIPNDRKVQMQVSKGKSLNNEQIYVAMRPIDLVDRAPETCMSSVGMGSIQLKQPQEATPALQWR